MGTDIVSAETMVVGSMSSIVVSASSIPDTIITDLQPQQDDHHQQQQTQLPQQHSEPQVETEQEFHRGNPLIQQSLTSSIIPVQQMIVIQDSVTVPGHAEFSVPPPTNHVISVSQPTSQVISMPPVTGQVISVPQSDSQVIPVPTINNQVISGTLSDPQVSFTVPVHQHSNYNINIS